MDQVREQAHTVLSRHHGGQLLLNSAPGVGSGLVSVEAVGQNELVDVDFRRGLEAVPGDFEDALFLLGEDDLGRGGFFGGGGRHGGGLGGAGWAVGLLWVRGWEVTYSSRCFELGCG